MKVTAFYPNTATSASLFINMTQKPIQVEQGFGNDMNRGLLTLHTANQPQNLCV